MRRPSLFLGAVLAMGATVLFVAWPTPPSSAVETCSPSGQTADAKVVLTPGPSYQPSTVSFAAPGKTVCWEHKDGRTPHSITFDDATPPIDYPGPACQSNGAGGAVNPDDCFQQDEQPLTIIFETAGSFHYHCKIHPIMTGVINVGGTPPTAARTTTTLNPNVTTTTKASTTNTTVGTLTTTTEGATTTSSTEVAVSSTTTSTLQLTTQTTASGTALGAKSNTDDDEPSGLLEAVGVILLAGAVAGLIPAWRRLT